MNSNQKKSSVIRKSLLEILREQTETKRPMSRSSSTRELKPNQAVTFGEIKTSPENGQRPQESWQNLLRFHQQERLIWSNTQKRVDLEIQAIRQELAQLVKSASVLAKEVEIAAKLAPVEPGVYHLNYFENLKITLKDILKRVNDSLTWLETSNRRAKRRNYYWGQVRKSGTKFMLSQERYMATQVG